MVTTGLYFPPHRSIWEFLPFGSDGGFVNCPTWFITGAFCPQFIIFLILPLVATNAILHSGWESRTVGFLQSQHHCCCKDWWVEVLCEQYLSPLWRMNASSPQHTSVSEDKGQHFKSTSEFQFSAALCTAHSKRKTPYFVTLGPNICPFPFFLASGYIHVWNLLGLSFCWSLL